MPSSLGHLPKGRWEFDEDVTRVFDDMLRRSIPEYETMRRLVHEVGRSFVQPRTDVVDLGCSRGEALAPFMLDARPDARYIGVDISQPMLEATSRRFERERANGKVELVELDLRNAYPAVSASLTLSVLTLQFIALERRVSLLRDIYEHTVEGGALILVEKVLGKSAELDGDFVRLYHEFKRSSGYSPEEIERKRLSLQGVLVPATAAENEEFLRRSGFVEVECFWRWLNFAGWIAIKRAQGC